MEEPKEKYQYQEFLVFDENKKIERIEYGYCAGASVTTDPYETYRWVIFYTNMTQEEYENTNWKKSVCPHYIEDITEIGFVNIVESILKDLGKSIRIGKNIRRNKNGR